MLKSDPHLWLIFIKFKFHILWAYSWQVWHIFPQGLCWDQSSNSYNHTEEKITLEPISPPTPVNWTGKVSEKLIDTAARWALTANLLLCHDLTIRGDFQKSRSCKRRSFASLFPTTYRNPAGGLPQLRTWKQWIAQVTHRTRTRNPLTRIALLKPAQPAAVDAFPVALSFSC